VYDLGDSLGDRGGAPCTTPAFVMHVPGAVFVRVVAFAGSSGPAGSRGLFFSV
jgi:hypothetical protein